MSNEITLEELIRLQNISDIEYGDVLEWMWSLDEYESARENHIVFNIIHGDDLKTTYSEDGIYVRGRLATAEKRLQQNKFHNAIPKKL